MRNTLKAAGMGPALLPLALGLAFAGGATIASAQSITLNFDTSCPNPMATGSGPNITISCGGTSGGPTSAPVCSPTASPNPVAPGGSVTLRANCSQSPTSYMWTGGLASHGAVIGLITAMWIYCKRRAIPFLEGADRFSFSAALGATLVRLGNLFNSEIIGARCRIRAGACGSSATTIRSSTATRRSSTRSGSACWCSAPCS